MKLSKGTGLILLGVSLVVIDQIIKVLVKTNMSLGEQIPLIGEWCRLCFVENEGMAFGLSFGEGIGKLLLSLFRIGLSALRDVASFYATISKRMEEFPYFSQIRGYNGRFIGVLKFKDKDAMERSKYEDLDVRDTPLYESVVGKKASQEPRLQGKNVTSAQEYSGANISSRQQEDSGYNGTSIRPHQREESDYHGTSIRPHQQQEEIYYNSTSIQPHQQEDDESNLPNDKCEDQQSQQIQFAHPPRPHADSRRRERYRSRRGDPPPHRTWEDIRRSCSVF